MSAVQGFGIELEEVGTVAMIGLLLVPGVLWIAKSKTGANAAVRAAFVGAVIAGAVAIEFAMENTANSAESLLEGKG
jgi:hypothetical protein